MNGLHMTVILWFVRFLEFRCHVTEQSKNIVTPKEGFWKSIYFILDGQYDHDTQISSGQ